MELRKLPGIKFPRVRKLCLFTFFGPNGSSDYRKFEKVFPSAVGKSREKARNIGARSEVYMKNL